jgi:hypothetical protein
MAGTPMYATQKLRDAVTRLALSEDGLRRRVLGTWSDMHILVAEKIPDERLQCKLEAILSEIQGSSEPIDNELKHLTDDNVSSIAGRIVDLYESCARLWESSNPSFGL